MSLFKNFAPWITFLVLTSTVNWQVGLAAGLVVQVALIVAARRVDLLNGAMLAFFLVMTAFALAQPNSSAQNAVAALSTGWLAAVSLTSLAIGRPFTLSYARVGVRPEVASSPLFFRTNQIITAVWTAYFATTAALGVASLLGLASTAVTAANIVLLVAAVKFTIDYPKRVHARAHPLAPAAS
jgi:hypothetical protein